MHARRVIRVLRRLLGAYEYMCVYRSGRLGAEAEKPSKIFGFGRLRRT